MDDDWFGNLRNRLNEMEEEYDLDEILHLFSNQYTRYTISYLSTSPTPSLEELTDVIAGLEAVERETIITPVAHDRIRIRLYHVILPQLEECGFIHFDAAEQTIQRSNVPPAVVDLLDDLP